MYIKDGLIDSYRPNTHYSGDLNSEQVKVHSVQFNKYLLLILTSKDITEDHHTIIVTMPIWA